MPQDEPLDLVIGLARDAARRTNYAEVRVAHLVIALCQYVAEASEDMRPGLEAEFARLGIDPAKLTERLTRLVTTKADAGGGSQRLHPNVDGIIRAASRSARKVKGDVTPDRLLRWTLRSMAFSRVVSVAHGSRVPDVL